MMCVCGNTIDANKYVELMYKIVCEIEEYLFLYLFHKITNRIIPKKYIFLFFFR